MTTNWKSGDKKSAEQKPTDQTTHNTISGTTLSSWTRQQKLAMGAGFAMLGMLLAASACSKQSPRTALVSVSGPAPTLAAPAAAVTPAPPTGAVSPAIAVVTKKKTGKKRPANVTYSDLNSGISFLYPRKFVLTSSEKTGPEIAALGNVPMNFVQPGGVEVVTVALPEGSYPGTDFASAFFKASVNRSVSEQECAHFAVVDTRDADGEPVDGEKVQVGASGMQKTSSFSANAIKQDETEYYHSYENGACYEYVLGLGTEGFATDGGIEHVNRDKVFARLEKILATVKINPVAAEPVAEQVVTNIARGKE